MEQKQRKLNRLAGYDYLDGNYFITICTDDRKECLGEIRDGKMLLNKCGEIAKEQWLWLEKNFDYVRLNEFMVMPNHLHGMIVIDRFNTGNVVCLGRDLSQQEKIKSLSQLIGAFKTTSSKLIHRNGFLDFNWQRSFFDRIIRSDKEMENITNYIVNNPYNWEKDRNNQENLLM
jgi:putative transposase